MFAPRSLFAALAVSLAVAVPVFAANSSSSGNNGAGTSSVSAPKPLNLAEGDVMVASVAVLSDTVTISTPLGWTPITTRVGAAPGGNPDVRLATYWKTATGTDVTAPNFTWTLSGAAAAFAGVARYNDVAVTSGTPVAATASNPTSDGNAVNSASLSATGVSTPGPGSYVTAFYGVTGGTVTAGPSQMNLLYNQGGLAAYDVSQVAGGASGNKAATSSAGRYVSQTIALKPKPIKLAYSTAARNGGVDECLGPITVQTQNFSSTPVQPLGATEVGVASDGAGSFFANAACDNALDPAERTIGTSQTSTTFYYKPTAAGSHTITATATDLAQAQQAQTAKQAQTIAFDPPPSPQVYGESFDIGSATSDSGLTVTVTPSGGCTLTGTTATITSAATDCTLTATQAGDDTYAAATPVVRTVVTDQRPITVTADSGQSKVYNNGASNPALTYQVTSGNLVGGDAFTGTLARVAGETVLGSPYAINQGTLSAGNNYAITFVGATFAITKRPLTLDAEPASKAYGAADPEFSGALTNFAPGHNNANHAGVTGKESCSRTGTHQNVGVYDDVISCTLGTLTAANYSFVLGSPADFTINKKAVSINAVAASKTYGQSDPAFSGTLSGFAFGENATTAGVTGAQSCSRTGSQQAAGTYNNVISCTAGTLTAANYSFVTGSLANFTINKKALTVDADPATKVYGPDPTYTASLNGFELGEDAASAGVTGVADCSRTGTQQDVGTYNDAISCTGGTLSAPNYSFTSGGSNDLTITKKQISVDADPASKTYGQSDPAFSATLDGLAFGETPSTADVTGSATCDRAGTDEDAGTYTDVISCDPNDLDAPNYSFAAGDAADFTINRKQLAINAAPASKTYGSSDPAFSGALSGFEFGEDATAAGITGAESCSRTGAQEDAGVHEDVISCAAGSLDAANYSFAAGAPADFTIDKKALPIDAAAASKTYGQSDPVLSGTLSGFEFGEDASSADVTGNASCSRAGAQQAVGTYDDVITCVQGTLSAANYAFVTGSAADFTIDKKQLQVDAAPKSKTYGATDPTFTANITGLEFGDDPSTAFTGNPGCSRSGADEDAGTYQDVISCTTGDLDAANYSFVAGDAADFTITAKTVSASFTAENKQYDRTTDATIGAGDLDETDLESGDVVTLDGTDAEADFDTRHAGTGKAVTASGFELDGADAGNYTLSLDPETADITQKPVDGSFVAADKEYDGTTAASVTDRSVNAADVIAPDVVTLTGGTATFDTADIGDGKTVTLAGATLGGADGGNYSVGTIATDQADITPKQLTPSFTVANKVYDQSSAATVTAQSVIGKAAGEDVDLTGGTASFGDANAGNAKTVTLTGAALSGAHMSNYTLPGADPTTTADITKKPVDGSFTAADKTYDGTTAAAVVTRSVDAADVLAGDAVTLTGGTASFNSPDVGTRTASLSGASVGGASAVNYSVGTIATDQADITRKAVVGNFTAADKVYDRSAGATVTGRSVNGAVTGDAVSLSGGTAQFADGDAGADKPVTLSGASLNGADAGNYSLGSVATAAADITKKPVTGSFTAADKDYDGTKNASITGRSLAGAIDGDEVSLSGGVAGFATPNPGTGLTVLGFSFGLAGADAGNYSLTSVEPTKATIRPPAGPVDTPPTDEEIEQGAGDKLGGEVKPLGGADFGGLAAAFAPEAQGNAISAANQPLFALGCLVDCNVTAGKTVVLSGEAGASAAATQKLKLKAQQLSLAEGELGVVKLKLTKKQRKAIRQANKAKLVVKVTVASGAQTVTDTKTYRLKATKG